MHRAGDQMIGSGLERKSFTVPVFPTMSGHLGEGAAVLIWFLFSFAELFYDIIKQRRMAIFLGPCFGFCNLIA